MKKGTPAKMRWAAKTALPYTLQVGTLQEMDADAARHLAQVTAAAPQSMTVLGCCGTMHTALAMTAVRCSSGAMDVSRHPWIGMDDHKNEI
jgi:hypothetical protein